MLAMAFQYIVKNKLTDELSLLGATQFDILDFAINVALFAGQEKVGVAACD